MAKSYVESKTMEKVNALKSSGHYPFFKSIEESEGSRVVVDGQELIMIGSNNYLGLTHHPLVKEAAIRAIEKFGTGCTGSRFLNGNLTIHEELEEKLARFIGHEKALLFSTGMQSNLGALSALCQPRDLILSDSENHASIIDGTRLALGTTLKFKHNNMESLEQLLSDNCEKYRDILIVADGVFSMTGEIADVPALVRLAEKYGASVYIDDAHGLGVMGPQGKGTINHFYLQDKVHFNMGTFSKSFASIGGFVSGSKDAMDYVKHTARSFIFSASMPPSAVATVKACIDLISHDPSILKNLWENVRFMREGFKSIGLYTYNSVTPIIPIFVGDEIKALQITKFLEQHGVFATPILSPAVPRDQTLIRTSYMASHQREDLARVLEVFALAKKVFDIPSERGSDMVLPLPNFQRHEGQPLKYQM